MVYPLYKYIKSWYTYFVLKERAGLNMFINSNNSRKMHRKKNKRKRFYTRCEAWEAVEAFLDYCDGYKDKKGR